MRICQQLFYLKYAQRVVNKIVQNAQLVYFCYISIDINTQIVYNLLKEGLIIMFENRLTELRESKKLNMKQTAQLLGIPYTTYVGYEKNEREPNSEVLILLADFFNCSVDYLIGRSDDKIDETVLDKVNSIDNDLIEKYGNIYEAQKAQNIRNLKNVDNDIRRIERARNKMPQEEKDLMMRIVKGAFSEYFDDDFVDDDTDE